jgi:hypothetical protein
LCGGLCAVCAIAAPAQAPDILRERPTAHVAALGGAGVAAIGLLDARSVNPALLAIDVPTTFSVGAFKTTATDVTGIRAGVTGALRGIGYLSLDVRRRQIEDLVEDSVLAGDPDLKVFDWGIQFGYARELMGGRLQVGASWEGLSSRVFGTTGVGWTLDLGAAAVISSNTSIGITAARLGPKYAWRDALGGSSHSSQGRTITAGVRWSLWQKRRIGVLVAGDVVRALEPVGDQGVRLGGEITLLRHLSLRGGYAQMRDAGNGVSSAGLGLTLRNIRIDIGRDRLGSVVGERTLLDFKIERRSKAG